MQFCAKVLPYNCSVAASLMRQLDITSSAPKQRKLWIISTPLLHTKRLKQTLKTYIYMSSLRVKKPKPFAVRLLKRTKWKPLSIPSVQASFLPEPLPTQTPLPSIYRKNTLRMPPLRPAPKLVCLCLGLALLVRKYIVSRY